MQIKHKHKHTQCGCLKRVHSILYRWYSQMYMYVKMHSSRVQLHHIATGTVECRCMLKCIVRACNSIISLQVQSNVYVC
jgi:hypothetical protein